MFLEVLFEQGFGVVLSNMFLLRVCFCIAIVCDFVCNFGMCCFSNLFVYMFEQLVHLKSLQLQDGNTKTQSGAVLKWPIM